MNPHITRAMATARFLDLQRAAACCTAPIEHRHAAALRTPGPAMGRLHPSRALGPVPVCCA